LALFETNFPEMYYIAANKCKQLICRRLADFGVVTRARPHGVFLLPKYGTETRKVHVDEMVTPLSGNSNQFGAVRRRLSRALIFDRSSGAADTPTFGQRLLRNGPLKRLRSRAMRSACTNVCRLPRKKKDVRQRRVLS
jgi:hypothetical protein